MINSVRNTVLSVLNKNNYGYISPSDFNLYAKNAQIEVYEEYFSNYNKTMNMENVRQAGTDYADISKTIAEVLDNFLVSDYLYPVPSNTLTIPIYSNTYNLPNIIQNAGGESYMINKIVYHRPIVSDVCLISNNPGEMTGNIDFVAAGASVGDVLFNYGLTGTAVGSSVYSTIIGFSTLLIPNDTILTAQDLVFFGGENLSVISKNPYSEAERVTNAKIDMLNASHLTTPTLKYPAYAQSLNTVSVYPESISASVSNQVPPLGAVKAVYFRYPKDPKWTYISLPLGEPAFDATAIDYQDFEMPLEDEYKLAMKILQYCGISIREAQVVQFAMAQEQHEQPTFSMQQ